MVLAGAPSASVRNVTARALMRWGFDAFETRVVLPDEIPVGRARVQNGARDGYEKGVEDARKNRSFDPLRHAWYRSGDRHFEGRYGSREQYKDLYRDGFRDGYERGYGESRYR